MRTEIFYEANYPSLDFNDASTIMDELAPWASIMYPIDSGYIAFESMSDYFHWKNQK